MKIKTVTIMQGLPGTGKTTLANQIAKDTNGIICSADNFYEKDGVYNFDKNKIHLAHKACHDKFTMLLNSNTYNSIIVDNTNLTHKEWSPYVKEAKLAGWSVKFAHPESPLAIAVSHYMSMARNDLTINEELESQILDKLEKETHRSGDYIRVIPRETYKAMLRRFEPIEN